MADFEKDVLRTRTGRDIASTSPTRPQDLRNFAHVSEWAPEVANGLCGPDNSYNAQVLVGKGGRSGRDCINVLA